MKTCLIFGLGYTATRFAVRLRAEGWQVTGTQRTRRPVGGIETLALDDPAVAARIQAADAILSSVPPDDHTDLPDPVLRRYGPELARAKAGWLGYLSSTGVYGDTQGEWVDENAPLGGGRRSARVEADLAWQALAPNADAPIHIFRLPGIYGPGRSAIDRVREGKAHRIDMPGHVFCRIHVDDIVGALMASIAKPARPGKGAVYNVADDEPASGSAVTEYACDLLGLPYPPLQSLDEAGLSPAARAFYGESRRISNAKIKRELGFSLRYPTYREGLRACLEGEEKPS